MTRVNKGIAKWVVPSQSYVWKYFIDSVVESSARMSNDWRGPAPFI